MTGFHMTALAEVHRAQLQRQADRQPASDNHQLI